MSQVSGTIHIDQQQHVGPTEKLTTLVAWGSGPALFLTAGWMAMQPNDPQGAISLLAQRGGLVVLIAVVSEAVAGIRRTADQAKPSI